MLSTSSSRPAVIVGDVGSSSAFHVGDEAMLEQFVTITGDRRWIAVSLDPATTTARLGVPAIGRLGFPAGNAAARREDRLTEVLADGPPCDDRAAAVIRALDEAGGLLVAGGGNLSSAWPEQLYERVALIALARHRGLPVVVSGQTIGPRLGAREREILGWALRQATLVGVRERASHRLALRLGVAPDRLALQLDDAMFLPGDDAGGAAPGGPPFAAVTVGELGGPAVHATLLDGLARGLAAVQDATGLSLVLVPHVGALHGPPSADVLVAQELLGRLRALGAQARTPGLLAPRAVAALTRRAALVIATRYHPLVFALGGAVPALALTLDEYTSTKMRGALALAGLNTWSLPVEAAAEGLLAPAAVELWERRGELVAHLRGLQDPWRHCAASHTTRVLAALDGRTVTSQEPVVPAGAPAATGPWTTGGRALATFRARAERDRHERDGEIRALRDTFAEVERYALSLRDALDATERHASALQDALDGVVVPDTRPAPGVTGVVLDDLRHEQVGLDAEASMRVQVDGEDGGRLVLRRHVARLEEIDRSGTPFVALAAMLAGACGRDLRLDAPVDPVALTGAGAAAGLLHDWFGWGVPAIGTAGPAARAAPVTARGLCFSRGLDSMTALISRREELDVLLGLDWRDAPWATDGTAAIWEHTQEAAGETGLPLVGVSTNARAFLDPVVPWDVSHGVVLAALAQLAAPALGELRIAGTYAPGHEEPHGSHPALVPLWSSSRVAVTYDPGPGARHRKAEVAAGDPFAMRWLKVCWERPGDGNCGHCTKCLLTMTDFALAGCLGAVRERFDGPLTPEAVAAAAGHDTAANIRSTLEALDENDPLRAAWQAVYDRVAPPAPPAGVARPQ